MQEVKVIVCQPLSAFHGVKWLIPLVVELVFESSLPCIQTAISWARYNIPCVLTRKRSVYSSSI